MDKAEYLKDQRIALLEDALKRANQAIADIADECKALSVPRVEEKQYDEGSGIVQGPFKECACPSHHEHGERGADGCPVCNPQLQPSEVEELAKLIQKSAYKQPDEENPNTIEGNSLYIAKQILSQGWRKSG